MSYCTFQFILTIIRMPSPTEYATPFSLLKARAYIAYTARHRPACRRDAAMSFSIYLKRHYSRDYEIYDANTGAVAAAVTAPFMSAWLNYE